MKLLLQLCFLRSVSRAPQGARGLKYVDFFSFQNLVSRAPQGARGLKYFLWESGLPLSHGRAPQGARGLK